MHFVKWKLFQNTLPPFFLLIINCVPHKLKSLSSIFGFLSCCCFFSFEKKNQRLSFHHLFFPLFLKNKWIFVLLYKRVFIQWHPNDMTNRKCKCKHDVKCEWNVLCVWVNWRGRQIRMQQRNFFPNAGNFDGKLVNIEVYLFVENKNKKHNFTEDLVIGSKLEPLCYVHLHIINKLLKLLSSCIIYARFTLTQTPTRCFLLLYFEECAV